MEHRLCRGIFPRKITKVINVGSYSFSIHKKIFRVPWYISIMNIQNFRFKDHPFGIFVALITFDKKKNVSIRKCMGFFNFRIHNVIFVRSDSVWDLNYYFLFLTLKQHICI